MALLALPAAASANSNGLPLPLLPGSSQKALEMVQSRLGTIETPSSGESAPEYRHIARLHARGGYEVAIIGSGNAVVLEVGRKHGKAITAYVVRGTVTPTGLKADFGALGRLSVRFHPGTGRGSLRRKHFCGGVPLTVDHYGTYTGVVRFTGEGGYVSLNAHRAKGDFTRHASHCGPGHSTRKSQASSRPTPLPKEVSRPRALFAGWRHGGDSVEFGAFTFFGKLLYAALSEQSEGRMAIERFATESAPLRTFALNEELTRVSLTPRKPFVGAALWGPPPDGSATWEGSLAVNFPGAPAFPLTGPQFEPELEAGF